MKILDFKYVKIHPKAVTPEKITGNLGFDLSVVRDDSFRLSYDNKSYRFILHPGQRHVFHTGLKIAIPNGYGAVYRDRSGMAAKFGIHVLAGVIDASYRGEWLVCLLNTSSNNYEIIEGDRIVQVIVLPEYSCTFQETKELEETERGEKGFGASGR